MELAYRLLVEESPFIQKIRNNVIVFLTPVLEVDGHEKVVDNLLLPEEDRQAHAAHLVGQLRRARQQPRRPRRRAEDHAEHPASTFLECHPTVLHDLHESMTYLYTSTGAGPYNTAIDPVQTDEWWLLSKYEVAEMTKRGVPGVWTWHVLRRLGAELPVLDRQSPQLASAGSTRRRATGPRNQTLNLPAASGEQANGTGPNPPLPTIKWGPRNNVNIQQSRRC